ncbi:MAG: RNA polymerase sigma factor [Acidobacteriaceae bacterium]
MDASATTNERMLTWAEPASDGDAIDAVPEIAALAAAHSALLFRVAFSILRNASDAEDAVQDTFLRVLKHRGKLASVENPRIWLIRIVWNLALDRKRRMRSASLIEEAEELLRNRASGETPAAEALRSAESCARILRLIDKLPRKEREVLRLSAMEELGTAEIAAILQTTESSVRSCLFRARQHLRERLDAEERGPTKP